MTAVRAVFLGTLFGAMGGCSSPGQPLDPPHETPTDGGSEPDAGISADAGPAVEAVRATPVELEACEPPAVGVVPAALEGVRRSPDLEVRGRTKAADHVAEWPTAAPCVAAQLFDAVYNAADAARPVASLIRAASAWLDEQAELRPVDVPSSGLEEAVGRLCLLAGAPCPVSPGLSEDLSRDLARIVDAARHVIEAHRGRTSVRGPDFWWAHGGIGLVPGTEGVGYTAGYEDDARYLFEGRADLYEAAARLAEAIESVSWARYRGREQAAWATDTPFGRIEVRGPEDDTYAFGGPWLFLLDMGGADTYLAEVGTNASAENVVSVLIDAGGPDVYAYPESGPDDALAADADGRVTNDRFAGATRSGRGGPGGARNGVALAFDLGVDDDVYRTLRFGQGYAHQGVGVLLDEGGDDVYRAEALAQGAAQFGIGLALDLGEGDDRYEAERLAQGSAYTRGFAALWDDGGQDEYRCVKTTESPRYPSTQDEDASASFCQGAGVGARFAAPEPPLAGGLGILADLAGDDRFEAEVYGQGVGYQDGLGVLLDSDGDDRFDAVWYALGAGVHGGQGIFVDVAGDDRYGSGGGLRHVALGAAHDRGTGVFVDVEGEDRYALPSMGAGAGSCTGVGLFGDETGTDVYTGGAAQRQGYATSVGCPLTGQTWGLFVDGLDVDDYDGSRDNDTEWGTVEGDGVAMGADKDAPTGLAKPWQER